MLDKECKSKCVDAGASLSNSHTLFKAINVTPVIYEDNLRGVVEPDDLKVPQSELAVRTGAAGKDIIAFFVTSGNTAHVVYDDGQGCCHFAQGRGDELTTPALRAQVKSMWPTEAPRRMIV